jgi:hypothetical protein
MYNNYKIVVNTAAGRRRYMRILIPYVLQSDIVDRYDLWINTNSNADIAFFKKVAEISPKINLIWQPEGIVNGVKSINAFYKYCTDHNTIYFKLDDDIVWMEPCTIEKMIKYRIDNPQYFLVTPLVINNGFTTMLLSIHDKIRLKPGYDISSCWGNGYFAYNIHKYFIENYIEDEKYKSLYVNNAIIGLNRFSINAVIWFGKDLDRIFGIVPGDDEEFLSLLYPTREGLACSWNGNTIVAHFAFGSQRGIMDSTDILDRYLKIAQIEFSNNSIFQKVESAYNYIEENIDEINCMPPVYKQNSNTTREKAKGSIISKYLPDTLKNFIIMYKNYKRINDTREYIDFF